MPDKEYISPISYEDDEPVINANCTQANDDFIRAARLQEEVNEGNKEAAQKLEEMEDTLMVRFPGEEEQ